MVLNLSHAMRGNVPGKGRFPLSVREGKARERGNARQPWPVAVPGQSKKPGTGTLWITRKNPAMTGPVAVFGAFPVWRHLTGNAGNGVKSDPVEQLKPVEPLIFLRSRLATPDRECDCRLWFVVGARVFGNVPRPKTCPSVIVC